MTRELHALEAEVRNFQAWADATVPLADRYNAWEVDYVDWLRIYQAAIDFMNAFPYAQWDSAAIRLLLYIIVRDNESEWLIREMAKSPDQLLLLAEHSITADEWDAKWQIAVALGHLGAQTPPA